MFDNSKIYSLGLSYSLSDFEQMITTYFESGQKDWIEATATVDGIEYSQVGVRLKGNTTLLSSIKRKPSPSAVDAGVTNQWSVDDPVSLPLLIRFDKFLEGQNHLGWTEIAIRSIERPTSLNEAVALELLQRAGLAAQGHVYTRFSINGSAERLRLIVENPNEQWSSEALGEGNLYKAEAGGDYSFRGSDPESYSTAWDQEVGDDVTPLIDFLDFINNSDDQTFADELEDRLDVESFARYLAFQELINNPDDIDGGGNNSYLFADESGVITVVAWDHNRSFGGESRLDPKASPNVLVRRFRATPQFEQLYQSAFETLTQELFESGVFQSVVDRLVSILKRDAVDLVDVSSIDKDAARILREFEG